MRNYDITILVIAVHILSLLSIGLDVPYLRQFMGFIYLTFIPGLVLLYVFNLTEKGTTTTVLLSVSLSLAFDLFIGLLLSAVGPFLGVTAPLTSNLSALFVISLTLTVFLISERNALKNFGSFNGVLTEKLSRRVLVICIIALLLLVFGSVGAVFKNVNLIILAIVCTAIVFITCAFSKETLPSKYYAFILFGVSLGLLYQTSLLSSHIMGWDIFNEYYVSRLTIDLGFWNSPGAVSTFSVIENYRSMLSITVLPALYSSFMKTSADIVFKLVYPFILAFVPLFLYKMYKSQLGKVIALLSAFFFIANPINFYGLESLSLAREMIGLLFFVAAFYTLISHEFEAKTVNVLFIVFSVAIAASAYSLSYIYAFLLILTFAGLWITGNRKKATLNLSMVIVVLVVIFAWYMFVSSPPLNKLGWVIGNILNNFTQDLFNSQSRLDPAFNLLSPTAQTTMVGLIHKLLVYLTQGLVVVGALVAALRPKVTKFRPEFRIVTVCATVLLVVCLIVPNLAPALNFTRFYRITMVFLSPLFFIGGLFLLKQFKAKFLVHSSLKNKFKKVHGLFLLTVIISAFFLFSSGFVDFLSGGYPTSYPLNYDKAKNSSNVIEKMTIIGNSVPEQDYISSTWLVSKVNSSFLAYADEVGMAVLSDYARLSKANVYPLLNTTTPESGYIYLREINMDANLVSYDLLGGYPQFNTSTISSLFSETDKIYSNGASEIYFSK